MMKALVVASVLLGAGTANAAYDPAQHNCSELQSVMRSQGQIAIERLFGSTTYYANPNCGATKEARVHYESAKDTSACALGFDCIATGN